MKWLKFEPVRVYAIAMALLGLAQTVCGALGVEVPAEVWGSVQLVIAAVFGELVRANVAPYSPLPATLQGAVRAANDEAKEQLASHAN